MKKILFMLATVGCLSLALGACGKKDEDGGGEEETTAPKGEEGEEAEGEEAEGEEAEGEEAEGEEAEGEETAAGDIEEFGVPECDEYVEKMTACLESDNFPAAARDAAQKGFKQAVDQWKQLPEAAKENMGQACKAALDAAKQAYSNMGCEF